MTAQDVLENAFYESKKLKISKINKEVIENVDILITWFIIIPLEMNSNLFFSKFQRMYFVKLIRKK